MSMSKNNLGIYIHVPFCKSKCPYCDFYSVPFCDETKYVEAVCKNIEIWRKKLSNRVDTIYFGGGTPSLLSADSVCSMIDSVKNNFESALLEITAEINPADYQSVDFEILKRSGVNRISLGAQSLCDKELKALGRRHSARDIFLSVDAVKKSGINNISLDLMLGIPYQTNKTIDDFVMFCGKNDIKHISAYLLKLEKNTPFYHNRTKLNLPDDDKIADIYEYACRKICDNGYNHYEISNFSASGFESRHNLKYWNLDEYLGIGPSAHSLIGGRRFYYKNSVSDFINNSIIYSEGDFEPEKEYAMLRLRLSDGLKNNLFKKIFNKNIPQNYFEKAKKYVDLGLALCTQDKICITQKGFLVSNTIISDIIS